MRWREGEGLTRAVTCCEPGRENLTNKYSVQFIENTIFPWDFSDQQLNNKGVSSLFMILSLIDI